MHQTTSVYLSRTSGLSREQRPRKTKIGTEVAYMYVTCDTDITLSRSKGQKSRSQLTGHIVAASRTAY